jgi:hypothetical protein
VTKAVARAILAPRGAVLVIITASLAPRASLVAQTHAHGSRDGARDSIASSAFVAAARAGTAKYRDLSVAIADGYRRVGGDLPSLGEHWVQLGRVATSRITPDEPPVLIYVRANGQPRLAGIGYTAHLAPGEPYPDFPAGPAAWHDHNGSVDEEVLPVNHGASSGPGGGSGGTRLAVMHAWLWLENPRGIWTTDNWALPFVRLGLRPDAASVPASAALSLVSGGEEYYARAIARIGALGAEEQERVRTVLTKSAAAVASLLAEDARRDRLTAAELARLEEIWTSMWDGVTASVRPDAAARVTGLRAVWRE